MNETSIQQIREAGETAGVTSLAVAFRDLGTGTTGGLDRDRWYHAASTIKLAVLLALFETLEREGIPDDARLHVRNQFTSLADGRYFRVSAARDGNDSVHERIGRTMRIRDLARHMIVTSSNLATNVLIEFLGTDAIRASLRDHGITGIDFRRGVEDERAWEAGINNRATAAGLASLLELMASGRAVSAGASERMLEILHDQEFVHGIPAGAPDEARVANKTGEISTVTHDAAIVYLPERDPIVLVVLTEWAAAGEASARRALVADVARLALGGVAGAAHG